MIIIIFVSLISYMFFFALIVAPTINKILEDKERSKMLRAIFPKNFKFGLSLSGAGLIFSLYNGKELEFILFLSISVFFLVNLYALIPKINFASDNIKNNPQVYSKIFKKLHLISVVLYLLQMLFSIFGIFIYFN